MSKEGIPPIPTTENPDVTIPREAVQVHGWLRQNAIQAIEATGLNGEDNALAVKPRPSKQIGSAINDYTTKPGLNTISADVVNDKDGNLFCTHGVMLPTTEYQNFGRVAEMETVFVRTGSLHYMIDGGDEQVAVAGNIIRVQKGQELAVRVSAPSDYICFYGEHGAEAEGQQVLARLWQESQEVLHALREKLGVEFSLLRMRGRNPDCVNSPDEGEPLRVWLNTTSGLDVNQATDDAQSLLKQYEEQFQQWWNKAFQVIGKELDHISFSPTGGNLFRPMSSAHLTWKKERVKDEIRYFAKQES